MNGEVEVKLLAGTVEHLSARILDLIINRAHLSIVKPLLQVNLQSSSKVLGRLPFLPLLFLPPPVPGPMLIKALMFVRVILLLYSNIE